MFFLVKEFFFFFWFFYGGGRGGSEVEREGREMRGGEGMGEGMVGVEEEGELLFFCVGVWDDEEDI